ncbi:hypothetical protein GCM10011415_36260 [Salipiger pallidus]|uniref:Uncharacterized protein n=1 Tax=Salipiger pallidus TaxID=1775170 RepID=A0A8J2ZMG3_9RHOB|nr:hypothetical protein [Salipiger pallidus]GGG83184.1 hypothetical protein GCM10011415_36260 [Salipiger pallidus]
MTYRTHGLAPILAIIAGAASAETVTFDPQPGETRTWRMEMSVRPGREGEPPDYSYATQRISSLTSMEVVDDKTLHILPLWFQTVVAGETYGTQGPLPDNMRQAMAEGFDATLNAGVITDVTPHGTAVVPQEVMTGLSQQFGAVLPPARLEATEGWSTTIAEFSGVPDVTVTVRHVTDDSVFLRYAGDDPSFRITGLAVLDRDEGWLRRVVMTTDQTADDGTTLRTTLAMAPEDYPFPIHADYTYERPDWHPVSDGLSAVEPLPTEADIFAHDQGRVRLENDLPTLDFTHLHEKMPSTGRLVVSDPQVFRGEQPVEMPMLALPSITLPNYHEEDGDPSFTSTTLIPTEQTQILPDVLEATEIRASVAWYPATPFTMTLTPDETGHAEVTKNGATARLSPTDEGFELIVSGREGDDFMWAVDEGTEAGSMIYAADRGPDWLTPAESLARRIASPQYSSVLVALKTDAPTPTLSVRVIRHPDTPAATREMAFLTDHGRRMDPDRAPDKVLLFKGDPPPRLEEVHPEGLDAAALHFRMGTLQAARCSAAFALPQTEAVFAEVTPNSDGYGGTRLLQMQSPDGTRTHFYEHGTQDVTLTCDATVTWEETEVQPDPDHPWQIDAEALDISPDLTYAQLMDQIRFVDAHGDALALTTPNGRGLALSDRINWAIFPDGTLRVAGRPARILRAVSRPDPFTRSFTVTFPDLPVPEEAPQ